MVKHYAMPVGVKYQKYTDIVQTLYQVRQNLRQQQLQLELMEEERLQASKHKQAGQMTEGDEYSTFLVNMIKSIEDPQQERFILITMLQDF